MAGKFANSVLTGLALLCLCFIVLMVVRHGWTASYGGLLAIAGILAGILMLPAYVRINSALLICSILFACYLGEMVLVLNPLSGQLSFVGTPWLPKSFGENISAAQIQAVAARQKHVEFDRRNKLTVITDLRAQGVDAWPNVPAEALYREWPEGSSAPALVIEGVGTMPLGGVANKVTVYCNESGAYTTYTSDEFGFHNPKGLWTANPIDIAAVGDSFTQGACVPTGANFVAVMRQQFPRTLNLGRAGNGPLSELASIKEYLYGVKPRLVFWCYFEGNDLSEDLLREKRNQILRKYLTAGFSQGLPDKQAAIDRALMAHVDAAQRSQLVSRRVRDRLTSAVREGAVLENVERILKLTHLREEVALAVRHTRERRTEHDPVERSPALDEDLWLFTQVLIEAQKTVNEWGGTLVFVYLPQWERYVDVKYANQDRERVLDTVHTLKMPIVDIHKVVQGKPDPLSFFPFRRRGHYTEVGNRLVAEELLRFAQGHA